MSRLLEHSIILMAVQFIAAAAYAQPISSDKGQKLDLQPDPKGRILFGTIDHRLDCSKKKIRGCTIFLTTQELVGSAPAPKIAAEVFVAENIKVDKRVDKKLESSDCAHLTRGQFVEIDCRYDPLESATITKYPVFEDATYILVLDSKQVPATVMIDQSCDTKQNSLGNSKQAKKQDP